MCAGNPGSTVFSVIASTPHPIVAVRNLRFVAELAGLTAAASSVDRWASDEFPESRTALSRRLATASGDLATPQVFGPVLLAAWAAGRLWRDPGLSRSAVRITESVLVAGAVTGVLKYTIGRARPGQSPGDPDHFRPFSGNNSFPSGHATAAFALATAIDRETGARWVPFVAYPVAGLVAWSRLRDNRHWLSDVAAGALIGSWVANRVTEAGGRSRGSAGGAAGPRSALVIEPLGHGGAAAGLICIF